ncbi:MAG: thiolase family protein [Chloroflexi bacterium]|nr:thiolase family protein [Chloroflexota bacterium]
MTVKGKTAICGLGITEMGKVYGRTATQFAIESIDMALKDAGLPKDELDGLLVYMGNSTGGSNDYSSVFIQNQMGLRNLRLFSYMDGMGSTASSMVQYAALAVANGMANYVACVFADAPLRDPKVSAGASFGGGRRPMPPGMLGLKLHNGFFGANTWYALAMQRHAHLYGTTSRQLGAIAVSQRQWAVKNPLAQMRSPITIADHQASRFIVEPLHLLDCCLVSNGGVAVIVTTADRARALRQPPAYIWGMGQAHRGDNTRAMPGDFIESPGARSKETAFRMAGITVEDVDVAQIYDCYTITVLITLEDYGFCGKGEGGPFVADGSLGPGGRLPTNTGGGELSGYYMRGHTPLSEGVIQARGQGGDRQVKDHNVVLITGNGGWMQHHSTLVLSPHAN